METPPRSSENALTLQFRTRVKLFFRPTGLSGDAGDAPDNEMDAGPRRRRR